MAENTLRLNTLTPNFITYDPIISQSKPFDGAALLAGVKGKIDNRSAANETFANTKSALAEARELINQDGETLAYFDSKAQQIKTKIDELIQGGNYRHAVDYAKQAAGDLAEDRGLNSLNKNYAAKQEYIKAITENKGLSEDDRTLYIENARARTSKPIYDNNGNIIDFERHDYSASVPSTVDFNNIAYTYSKALPSQQGQYDSTDKKPYSSYNFGTGVTTNANGSKYDVVTTKYDKLTEEQLQTAFDNAWRDNKDLRYYYTNRYGVLKENKKVNLANLSKELGIPVNEIERQLLAGTLTTSDSYSSEANRLISRLNSVNKELRGSNNAPIANADEYATREYDTQVEAYKKQYAHDYKFISTNYYTPNNGKKGTEVADEKKPTPGIQTIPQPGTPVIIDEQGDTIDLNGEGEKASDFEESNKNVSKEAANYSRKGTASTNTAAAVAKLVGQTDLSNTILGGN